MFISNFLSERLQLSCSSSIWMNPTDSVSQPETWPLFWFWCCTRVWDVSFLCVNLSPVIFPTHLIDALLLECLLKCLFCLGVQRSRFVEIHIFANSQVKYKVWIFFFSVTNNFSSLWSTFQVIPSGAFGSRMECSGKVMIEKANRHCCPGGSGFYVAENI